MSYQASEVVLPEGACALCGQPIGGTGLCGDCHGDLWTPPREHKRQRPPRVLTPEQQERKRELDRAWRRAKRADPDYLARENALRVEWYASHPDAQERHKEQNRRWDRNKRQLATVGEA